MEKRKKTHVDYVLEREIRHAYDVLDDLKFIRQLYREDRQEQAYGFSLGTVKVAENLTLNVRHLAVSLNAPCAEKDVPRMVDQTYKVEIGFTEHEYFCVRMPLLIPGKDDYSLRYLKNNLSAMLLRFYEHRPRLQSKHSIVVFRHLVMAVKFFLPTKKKEENQSAADNAKAKKRPRLLWCWAS